MYPRTMYRFPPVGMVLVVLLLGCDRGPNRSDATNTTVPNSVDAESQGFTQIAENLFSRDLESGNPANAAFEIVENSGIEFTNELRKENHLKLVETGAGVAIGDFDQDGIPDVYLVSTDGQNRLYRGSGNFKFEDVTESAGVDGSVNGEDVWGTGATFADVDNDGDLDLFVCNTSARNLLYINQGDGTFAEEATDRGVDHVAASKVGAFCDFDNDGDLDLFLLTNQEEGRPTKGKVREVNGELAVEPGFEEVYGIIDGRMVPAGQRDVLYENDGSGRFVNVTEKAGIEGFDFGLSATWFDYDGDNWMDLYIANDFKGSDYLYRNNRDGTFTNVIGEATNHTPWFSMGSSAGDLNNDGYEDLMVADMSGTNHYKQKVNMGNMSDSGWFLSYGHPRQYMRNAFFANSGVGQFYECAFMSDLDSTDWTWAVKFGDLDNDGLQDIFITNGHARNTMDSDFVNESRVKVKEMTPEEFKAYEQSQPPILETNIAYRNKGGFEFEEYAENWNLALNGVSHGVAYSDLDRDGDLDMVVNNLNAPVAVYRNQTTSNDSILVELRGTTSNRFGIGAKVEVWAGDEYQMRRLSPTNGYISTDEPVVHFGLGDEVKIDKLVVSWPSGAVQDFADLDAGRFYRIVETESVSKTEAKSETNLVMFEEIPSAAGISFDNNEVEFDDYQREPLLPYQLSRLGPGVAWGDVNGDGFSDVYVGGPSPQSGKLYINENGKRFVEREGPWKEHFYQEDMGSLFFDVDSDGDQDLYVASGSNQRDPGDEIYLNRLYLNDGEGNFETAGEDVLPDNKDSSSCVVAADFDRDGDLDLFVGSRSIPGKYPLAPNSRLLRNDDGKLVDATDEVSQTLKTIGMVNSAVWSDYNNDGWIDLLLAIDWGPVRVFKNNEGNLIDTTAESGLAETLGWWHGIASGDFDNDGDIDYIAANQGLNSKYHCNAEHPHRLYYDDFDGNGTLDLVEAEFEGDVEFPMRGRSCSSHCMPFIAEKFETFHEFALAPVDDIYDLDTKDSPSLTVNELRSAVLWNEAGDFKIEFLPQLVQVSPGFGVAVDDYDLDGNLDVVISQNFFGSQPETGYMDGGLSQLLKGDGKGGFEAVWPGQSGISILEDAMVATQSDFDRDGDSDLLFIANSGKATLLRNNRSNNATGYRLVLKGVDGNLQAVGALIEIETTDARKRVFEISSSSGYLGNSIPSVSISKSEFESVKTIKVRWPDGSESEHIDTEPNNHGEIELSKS